MRNPAMLITSFNRPNIHYTVTLLDVQQPPALNCNSDDAQRQHSSAVSSTPARSTAAAAVRGHALHADDEAGDNQDDDADFAGYDQLLQLLKPAGRPKRKEQQLNEARQKQRPQREGPPGNNNSKSWAGPVAIIYALKRSTVDVLVRRLSSQGLAVAGYHATLPDAFRAGVLEQWRAGQLQVHHYHAISSCCLAILPTCCLTLHSGNMHGVHAQCTHMHSVQTLSACPA